MNYITFEGEQIRIGVTPAILTHCGFTSPDEVREIAAKCSAGEPLMKMDDVAEYLKFRN